jgi:hypothetical protein
MKKAIERIKREKYYFIYIGILISITSYFSFLILTDSVQIKPSIVGQFFRINNEKIEVQVPFIESNEFEADPMKCKPCEKVGIDPPRCPQRCNRRSNNIRLYSELIPNFEQIYDGNWICLPPTVIRINSYGFRDYEYSLEKQPNTYRIIALGDSHTFGLGVNLTDTYPKVLERLLNERNDGRKYEVLNFGNPGANLVEKIEFLKEKGILFHPDLIILQWDADDRLNRTEWEEFVNSYIERYLIEHNLQKEKLNRFTYDQIHSEAHKAYMTFKLLNNSPAKLKVELEEKFKELDEIAYKQRAKVILLLFHTITTDKPILKQIAAKYEWPIVDCSKYENSQYALHEKDTHPNQLGHRFIALEIYKKLVELSLV